MHIYAAMLSTMLSVSRVLVILALVFAWFLASNISGPSTAMAQSGGLPPLPFVFEGNVYLDGEVLGRDAVLSVRIGSWESRPVDVRDGRYSRLIVGPPDSSYIGQDVVFYLDGTIRSDDHFTFVNLGEPRFEPRDIFFGSRKTAQPDVVKDLADPDVENAVQTNPGVIPPETESNDIDSNFHDPVVITSGTPWALIAAALGLVLLLGFLLLRRLFTRTR